MTIPRLVPHPPPHKVNAGGDEMKAHYNGNTLIMIDESYIENRTEEQYQRDYEQLQEAAWAIIDELVALGEAV